MSKVIKIKKGLDIKLTGKPSAQTAPGLASETYAIKPTDFPGLTPKLKVKVDDQVQAGSTLFFDKYQPELTFSSPVSGKVVAINRGERRRILEVVVAPEGNDYVDFGKATASGMSREEVKQRLLDSGAWPFLRQRPYAVLAKPTDVPKHIYIAAFDSAPLAPDYNYVLAGQVASLQAGIDALSKLTDGKVRLSIDADKTDNNLWNSLKNVEVYGFSGAHPKGAIGVQIHHIEPINKGDIVWYVGVQEVAIIGKLFTEGHFDASKTVVLSGAQVSAPQYYTTKIGCTVRSLVDGKLKAGDNRIISGNVLTGEAIAADSYLGFYDSQLTVIEEGREAEFLGWGTPGFGKWSISRTFFSWLAPNKEYNLNTNMRGGHRPFVVSGEYNRVVPMDILPVQLLKAIIIEDIDLMEQLGIYEVAEEDLALCEVVCTSKTEVQRIVRKGLDLVRKEMS